MPLFSILAKRENQRYMKADPNKKSLIIVESPTKARTIKRYLGQNCTVMASLGHIEDLAVQPKKGVHGVMVDDGYELEYEMSDEKKKLLSEMRKELAKADQLILASDEDREGESIAWHLYNNLKPKVPCYRMVFHEITKQAITNAFNNCREIDMNLVSAQEARRAIDRLQGYEISPILARKIGFTKASAGRVQSPGLKIIVDREKERRDFIRNDYTSVNVFFEDFKAKLDAVGSKIVATKSSFDGTSGKIKDGHIALTAAEAAAIIRDLRGSKATVRNVSRQEKKTSPAYPFTTSTLQQDASRKLNKSVKEIMSIAQALYEKGFITYMRTDSPNLSSECIRASRAQIKTLFGDGYLSSYERNYKAKSESAQEAHEAIRPAGDSFRTPKDTGLTGDELKLYTLIWKRTLATQMKDALRAVTSVKLESGDYKLSASGTELLFDGFLKLYSESSDESSNEDDEGENTRLLPSLKEGDERTVEDAAEVSHTTEPPLRYNEASLVKTLEDKGIGRPSTYAQIISTIMGKGYAVKLKSSLVPTFLGFFVADFLDSAFPLYVGYDFTSRMEEGLDEIASGKEDKNDYLDLFWKGKDGGSGLKDAVSNVSRGVRISEAKTLHLSNLSYSFSSAGREYGYSIKNGKYGPYIEIREKGSESVEYASIDESAYYPGTFTDDDARKIFEDKNRKADIISGTDIEIRNSRNGTYLYRESDGKSVSLPRLMKAENLTADDATFLFSLPKVIGEDELGVAELRVGPYGYYISYDGKNTSVKDPRSVSFASFKADLESAATKSEKTVLRTFPDLEGKGLEILSGRYGAYLKWGERNIALSKEDRDNIDSLSAEMVNELALNAPEKKRTFRRRKS